MWLKEFPSSSFFLLWWSPSDWIEVLKKIGIELKEEQFEDIKEIIQKASDSEELASARNRAKDEAWMNRGQSAKLTVDFMIEKSGDFKKELK